MLGELKGVGTVALRCCTGVHHFELLSYADESWAIRRDGQVIDSWEPSEQESCMRTFGRLIGLKDHPEKLTILLVQHVSRFTSTAPTTSLN
jgi:hypothetical protein